MPSDPDPGSYFLSFCSLLFNDRSSLQMPQLVPQKPHPNISKITNFHPRLIFAQNCHRWYNKRRESPESDDRDWSSKWVAILVAERDCEVGLCILILPLLKDVGQLLPRRLYLLLLAGCLQQ